MIPAWVESYIGIPYLENGRDRDGLDCFGLLGLIWREHFGIELLDYDGPHWHKGADAREIGAAIAREMGRYVTVVFGDEQEGDGIILRMRGNPLHVGLVVAPGWMIHVHETAATCLENYRGMAWHRRVLGFRRYVHV